MLSRWLPPIASEHGAMIDTSLVWVHWLMAILFVAGYGFLVWMWQLLFAGPPTGP